MSIRARIVLLSTALMAVVLVSVSLGVYQMLMRSLESDVNNRLYRVADSYRLQSTITPSIDGQLVLEAPGDLDPFAYPGLYIQVTRADGRVVDQSPARSTTLEVPESVANQNQQGNAVYFTTQSNNNNVRVISAPLKGRDGTLFGTVQASESLKPMEQALDQLKLFLISGSLIGITMTGLGAYLLTGQSLRPLTHITEAVRNVGQSRDLKHEIRAPATGDEIQQLAETFNHMLVRLDSAFHAERRFVGDASHELRTPLTALRGNAEILLRQIERGDPDTSDLQEGLADIRDEAERMGRLVEHLLTLARADVGWRPEMSDISLEQVARDAARVAAPLSERHQFTTDIGSDLRVMGNADQLRQLILILLDNAFAYTPVGGTVQLHAYAADGYANIDVIDGGPGMSEEQVNRIFDRFYRGSAARQGGTSGAGLGLAIAKWITDCHSGDIDTSSTQGEGTRMSVRIRLAETPEEVPEAVEQHSTGTQTARQALGE